MAKSDNPDIAVLQEKVEITNESLKDLKSDVKIIIAGMANYVTKDEFRLSRGLHWVSTALTAVLVAIVTGLVEYFVIMSVHK